MNSPRSSRAGQRAPVRLPTAIHLILVLVSIAFVGWACIRCAVVAADADGDTALASRFWPGHPEILRANIMLGVARAATRGTSIGAGTGRELERLSAIAPLSSTPFAIDGALALRAGRYGEAEPLLVEARRRDPRDRGVRFLLADLYLREGRMQASVRNLSLRGA